MRFKHKLWRNGPGGRWDCRITWYGEGKDAVDNIRLECECPVGKMNIYPDTKHDADRIWKEFRILAEVGDVDALWDFVINELQPASDNTPYRKSQPVGL